MLRALLLILELALLALIVYNLAVALFGWKNPTPARPGTERSRFVVVIPAHNEERVIALPINDLTEQLRSGDELWVLADRCTDATAAVARRNGAEVAERSTGPDGKGAALGWFLNEHPLAPDQALVVVDADNHLQAQLLGRFAAELAAGHSVLQAFLDVTNPDQSPVATASALSYWASNRMVQLARTNLGWPADLGGTGMCITATALQAAGGFGDSLVEDQDLGIRCFLAGYPVRWLHDVRIGDEKPAKAAVAMRQRSRWISGRRTLARQWLGKLLARGRPPAFDLALRLVQPSRIGVAMLSALAAVASALGAPLFPWPLWAAVAFGQLVIPIPFLLRDGVPARYLSRYPLLVLLPVLKLAGRFRRNREWYHTPHGQIADD
ncbi:MAG: glycosyltransferase family 2 protein [Acidimicrobiia bacterium]